MDAQFRTWIRERDEGCTVLLASHILAEVEALCDRVSIIRDGRNVESGSLADLRHLSRTSITAEIEGSPDSLAGLPGVHELSVAGSKVELEVDGDRIGEVVAHLAASGIRALTSRPPRWRSSSCATTTPPPEPERGPEPALDPEPMPTPEPSRRLGHEHWGYEHWGYEHRVMSTGS